MNYEQMSLAELRLAAKERGMKGISTLRKQDLMDAIKKFDAMKTLEKPEPEEKEQEAPQLVQAAPERNYPEAGTPVVRRTPRVLTPEARERVVNRALRPVRREGQNGPIRDTQ